MITCVNYKNNLKDMYPAGSRVKLETFEDPQAPEPGTAGTVICVDDIGQIHVAWDNGSSLALIPEIDKFSKF